jgi:small subunit ribosomal protein S12
MLVQIKKKNKVKIKSKTYLLFKSPQKKATCQKVTVMKPKKPNSATRKVVKVSFMKSKRKPFCHIPGIKHNLQKFATVLLRGGRARDLPGVKYRVVRGVLDLRNVYDRFRGRSKYGVKKGLT